MAGLLVFSIVSLAVFCQSKPLTRFARSLIQGSRPPTATFEHFTGEGVKVTVALASAMIDGRVMKLRTDILPTLTQR